MKIASESASTLLWDNAYALSSTCFRQTGYRTPILEYANQDLHSTVAETFLLNSGLKRTDAEKEASVSYYLSDDGLQTVALIDEEILPENSIVLPKPEKLNLSIGEAISSRRSKRLYTGDSIPLSFLSTLLAAGNGISAVSEVMSERGDRVHLRHRTVPSGGGLYPIQIYMLVNHVDGLKRGVYRYQPLQQALIVESTDSNLIEKIRASSSMEVATQTSTASLLLFLVGKPWRSMRKYGNQGLRFVFHECGGIAQNIHLAATGLGLGSLDCAGFYPHEMNQALGFNGVGQTFLHTIFVGTSG